MIFLITGLIAAVLGALPPGTVNLSVVHTTINKGAKQAYPIIIAASFTELIVAYLSFKFSIPIENAIIEYSFIQYVIAAIMISFGTILIFKKTKTIEPKSLSKKQGVFRGIVLALLNPPVFAFWIIAFTYISNANILVLKEIHQIILFFLGILIGKAATLLAYQKISSKMSNGSLKITKRFNQSIGIVLVVLGAIQLLK